MSKLDYSKSRVYLRDKLVPFSEANLHMASSPVLYGLSIYTVFSVNWDKQQQKLSIFRLRDHYDRLVKSAKILDFHSFANEWPYERFQEIMIELIRQNNIRENVLIRATVFIDELLAGTRIHDLKNSLAAFIYPLGEILPRNGVKACVSSWVRTPDYAIPSRAKINGSYVNSALMKNEALLSGYDEAIALDSYGHVCEATIANIFIVRGQELITPDSSSDILEGITRDSVMAIAQSLGIKVHERAVDRSELYIADEIFLCGSSALVTPVISVDGRPIGSGEQGAMTTQLSQVYEAAQAGKEPKFAGWLTSV